MYDDSNPALGRLREICLALPETYEKEAWGECTFRVNGGSMFAMTDNGHHGSGHVAVWVKAPPMVQEILVHADAKRFFVPPYVGAKGWVGVRLDYEVDWDELSGILKDGYEMSIPKRLRGRAAPARDEAAVAGGAVKAKRLIGRETKPKRVSRKTPRRSR
jgi:hypothetical protein